jgi:hypothetical protein
MAASVTYTVHGAAITDVPIEVVVNGEKLSATRRRTVVELVPAEGADHGSVKLALTGEEAEGFVEGAIVTATFATAKGGK